MLDGIPILDLTPAALLGITVVLLLTGRIVPRAILQDKIEEAGQWRTAYEKEREARATADRQTAELLEVSRTTKKLLEAIFLNSERFRESGDFDVPLSETKS